MSCGEHRRAAELSELAQDYLQHFAEFDRWVRRASEGEAGFGVSDAWQEVVFAKLRHDPHVISAWVNRPEMDVPVLSFPQGQMLPKNIPWVLLRQEGFHHLYAAKVLLSAHAIPSLILSHQAAEKPFVQVIVAYRLRRQ